MATAIGALTGIGIWVHVNIINPAAIGALLRVFFWKWFIEWIVFNVEMVLLLMLFLSWKNRQFIVRLSTFSALYACFLLQL